jgi:F-type H+-transporting ATPase subunit gamma
LSIINTTEILRKSPATELVVVGEKGKAGLLREFNRQFVFSATELGKKQLNFIDVEPIAEQITNREFDSAMVVSNKFVSVLSFETLFKQLHSAEFWREKADLTEYEFDEGERPEVMQNYFEYSAAAMLYSALTENAATELSARMTSMDNATSMFVVIKYRMLTRWQRESERERERDAMQCNAMQSGEVAWWLDSSTLTNQSINE